MVCQLANLTLLPMHVPHYRVYAWSDLNLYSPGDTTSIVNQEVLN
jgi:hypothetical protein